MPKTWKIKKKANKFITRPYPSGHPLENSISINVVMRDMIKLVKTRKEVKSILKNNNVLVNGSRRRDDKTAIGLFDVLTIKETNESYRVILDPLGRLISKKIDPKEANLVLCKIIGKTNIKGGKLQLNCFNGINIITTKKEYKTGDVLLYDYSAKKL